jgi:hypothetical protein
MNVNRHDRDILRRLAEKKAAVAAMPVQEERRQLWTALNRLDPVKPMVWLNEVPWNEVKSCELNLECSDLFCQSIEKKLRRELYQWDHMPGDMVVEPAIESPLAITDTGFGIEEDVESITLDPGSYVKSRHFKIQISDTDDVSKIKDPVVTHDVFKSEESFQAMAGIFKDVIPVRKAGLRGLWFAPWDYLIRWTGVEEALTDMALRPDYIHALISRLVEAYQKMLDQYESLCLLSLNNQNVRIGSGAYGYSDELPAKGFNPEQVKTGDLWGCATAQIFSEVSPEMHWEFAMQYEVRWMERFGLNYYGCCEPLHNKLEILKCVPRLRKISVSAWMDVNKAVREAGGKYVFSLKPNPAFLAEDTWRPDQVRKELETKLAVMRGCPVEIIMKDISTFRYEPERLWEWAKIASKTAEKYA